MPMCSCLCCFLDLQNLGRDKPDMIRKCNEGKHQKKQEREWQEITSVRKQGADNARLRGPWKDFRLYSK